MKKTLRLGFGRQPLHNFFLLIRLISSYIPKIIILACLILEIAMKKTLKLGFGRRPYNILNFFLHISSSYVKVKLHAKNQLPMCPGSRTFWWGCHPCCYGGITMSTQPSFSFGLGWSLTIPVPIFSISRGFSPEWIEYRLYTFQQSGFK